MIDYLQQLRDEDAVQLGKCYLGHEDNMSNAARIIMLPLFLPNSPYLLVTARTNEDTVSSRLTSDRT